MDYLNLIRKIGKQFNSYDQMKNRIGSQVAWKAVSDFELGVIER